MPIYFFMNPQIEYKYDKEMLKGCVMSVVDDKLTVLAKNNSDMSNVSPSVTLSVYSHTQDMPHQPEQP